MAISEAYKAASETSCNKKSLEILDNVWREQGLTPLDQRGDTILHFLAIYGNKAAFQLFLEGGPVSNEHLKAKNIYGDTPLHEAARFGQKEVAEWMLQRERDLSLACNVLGETPLYIAAANGKKAVFMMLLDFNSDVVMLNRNDGCTVLHAAVTGEHYSLAIRIVESYPDLACKQNERGETALNLLATKVYSFKSGSTYLFRDVGLTNFVLIQLLEAVIYTCIPATYRETKCCGNVEDARGAEIGLCKIERSSLARIILAIPWLRKIDEAKQRHILARILAKRLIAKEDWSRYMYCDIRVLPEPAANNSQDHPLIQATKHGINELAEEILKVHPEAVETIDGKGRNLLHLAVEQKNRFLYDYLMKTVAHKDRMMTDTDKEGNTVLHFATTVGTPPATPPGVLFQMMWDVLWFKRVQSNSYQHSWSAKNNKDKTAKQVFDENHADIRKEAERTTKEITNGVLIVSALIATISFASIFTIPGGFDQTTGMPLHNNTEWRDDLQRLLNYLSASLLSSIIAMAAMITILLSTFDTDTFYFSLPIRQIFANGSLFYSTCFIILAGCQAYILEDSLRRSSTTLVILLSSVSLAALTFLDNCYTTFDYLYYVIRYSFSSRRQVPPEE